jgi:hypothetical protein
VLIAVGLLAQRWIRRQKSRRATIAVVARPAPTATDANATAGLNSPSRRSHSRRTQPAEAVPIPGWPPRPTPVTAPASPASVSRLPRCASLFRSPRPAQVAPSPVHLAGWPPGPMPVIAPASPAPRLPRCGSLVRSPANTPLSAGSTATPSRVEISARTPQSAYLPDERSTPDTSPIYEFRAPAPSPRPRPAAIAEEVDPAETDAGGELPLAADTGSGDQVAPLAHSASLAMEDYVEEELAEDDLG